MLVARRCAEAKPVAEVVPVDLYVLGAEHANGIHQLQSRMRRVAFLKLPREANAAVPRKNPAGSRRRPAHALHDGAASPLVAKRGQDDMHATPTQGPRSVLVADEIETRLPKEAFHRSQVLYSRRRAPLEPRDNAHCAVLRDTVLVSHAKRIGDTGERRDATQLPDGHTLAAALE